MKQMIEGDTGPQMIGVTTYPYTRLQHEYLDDFQGVLRFCREDLGAKICEGCVYDTDLTADKAKMKIQRLFSTKAGEDVYHTMS